jgi:hypothetical protein
MDFSVHQMGHELSARFDAAHGASLSTLWGAWAESVYKEDEKRFERYAKRVWGAEGNGIGETVGFFREIGMPVCLSELGIGVLSGEEIDELADRCTFRGKRTIGQLKPLGAEGIAEVYRRVNK